MTLKSEKNIRGFEHKEMYMLHKLDIQRLTGKKSTNKSPIDVAIVMALYINR